MTTPSSASAKDNPTSKNQARHLNTSFEDPTAATSWYCVHVREHSYTMRKALQPMLPGAA